jgi:hypothetical protein
MSHRDVQGIRSAKKDSFFSPGPGLLQIEAECFADDPGQWICSAVPGLPLGHQQSIVLPVDIIERKGGDLASS